MAKTLGIAKHFSIGILFLYFVSVQIVMQLRVTMILILRFQLIIFSTHKENSSANEQQC